MDLNFSITHTVGQDEYAFTHRALGTSAHTVKANAVRYYKYSEKEHIILSSICMQSSPHLLCKYASSGLTPSSAPLRQIPAQCSIQWVVPQKAPVAVAVAMVVAAAAAAVIGVAAAAAAAAIIGVAAGIAIAAAAICVRVRARSCVLCCAVHVQRELNPTLYMRCFVGCKRRRQYC